MDLLSIPNNYMKKGRPHGHRYGKKPGDREYCIANQPKKKCKKRCFHGIHDRFIRYEQFRSRMIENGRNEDACRQMDALADEDHAHHLTSQEYFCYKINWSTSQQLKEKEEAQRNQRWAQSSSSWWIGKVLGGLLIPMKVTMKMKPSTDRTVRPVVQYLEQFFWARLS